jgi:hypothetical protein
MLALYVAAPPPFFSPDAANYIYAGHSWSVGHVDTTAYKIGSRIYVVAVYFFPQMLLGVSIDTLSLTLAALAFLTFLIISVWVGSIVDKRFRFIVALAAIVIASIWIEWDRPLTENVFAPLAFASLLLFDLSRKATNFASILACLTACAALCALAYGVRPEAVFLFMALWVTNALSQMIDGLRKVIALSIMIFVFATIGTLPSIIFPAFTGKPMPYQIKEYFLFYRSVAYFGDRSYGPASEELYQYVPHRRLGQLEKHQVLPAGLGEAIVIRGPEYASRLYGKAGFETLKADPAGVAMDTLASFGWYLFSPSIRLRLETDSTYAERWQKMENWLALRDVRRDQRAWFEGPAPWRFSELVSNRLAVAPALEVFGKIPPVRLLVPPLLITVLMVTTLLVSYRRRDFCNSSVVSCLYFLSAVALASFSQGFLERYWSNASLISSVACLICLASPIANRAQIQSKKLI